MDDEAYASAMLAVLANPEPSGIDPADPYGMADDGIDRYDGFGRDVCVESVKLVAGDHGAELEVGFVFALPDELAEQGMPSVGSVRVPADREWRELSGYQEPADYAPAVARAVEGAASQMVRDHRSRQLGHVPTLPAPPGTNWDTLLRGLAGHGTPVHTAAGRIELREPQEVVTILVTPAQWEHVVAAHAGNDIEMYLDELLAPRDEDELFVVFYKGELARSTRATLPPVRGRALADELRAIRAKNAMAQVGWFAHTPPRAESAE